MAGETAAAADATTAAPPNPKATAAVVFGGLGLLFIIGYFVAAAQPKPQRR